MIFLSFTRNIVRSSQRSGAWIVSSSFSTAMKNEVRLSKRMSELGICSRREAARILKDTSESSNQRALKSVIYVRGNPVMGGTGVKVAQDEKYIEIRSGDAATTSNESHNDALKEYVPYAERPWHEICGDSIVLNKPIGYVSGQEEHQHVPAVRLLTRSNNIDTDVDGIVSSSLQYTKKKWSGLDIETSSVPKHIRNTLNRDGKAVVDQDNKWEATLQGYACAGRLDINSTGVLIFTRAGMMARRLISPQSKITKEYIVKVAPAVQLTARESEMGMKLPPLTTDLESFLEGGRRLWDDAKPLKPVVEAEWLQNDPEEQPQIRTLRLVLQEGKKRQIRRMCRELLGLHVVDLVRTRIGPVKIDSLPEGKWRTLTKEEVQGIFMDRPKKKKKKGKKKRKSFVSIDT
mmetsp:Transcript_19509/g.39124  ORF Transcript_19509/g.39124 Transcript_19509/m.39124 type:complete len:404 (+) Transcript_19509:38-1249(+)